MTWTREWQTGFEMGATSECDFTDDFSYDDEFSQYLPITGDFSVRWTGPGGGLGHLFMHNPVMLRANVMFSTTYGLGTTDILHLYLRTGGRIDHILLRWSPGDLKLTLYYYRAQDDVVTDTASVDATAEYGFQSDGTLMSIGIVAFADHDNGWASAYINGQKVLTIGTTPNNVVTNFFAAKVGESFSSGMIGWMDNFYIDYSGIEESDECPPSYFYVMERPTSDGDNSDWSPRSGGTNHEEVDELVSSDNEYNYETSPVGGPKDSFGLSTLSLPSDASIASVIPVARSKAGTQTEELKLRLNAHGVSDINGSDQLIATGYTFLSERMELAPSGSGWSQSEFNSCEFGYELRS